MKKKTRYFIATVMFASIAISQASLLSRKPEGAIDINSIELVPYTTFEADTEAKAINIVYFDEAQQYVYYQKTDETYLKTINPEYDMFKRDMLESGLIVESATTFIEDQEPKTSGFWLLAFMISIMSCISTLLRFIHAAMVEKNDRLTPVTTTPSITKAKSVATKSEPQKDDNVRSFQDIAGLHEVKKDMQCLVDFLKNKDKYMEAGAVLPKGVILYGPPGTGKTLLAKAVAGEAGVPFHYMSGSDFVEMYVGVGAKRVRELFEKAKKDAPCIIFIDEIDAIGGKRGKDDSNGEDRKTINALLTEMDGFKSSDNILIIAATNRLEDLDDALVRPGRFTNKFCVPLPETAKERLEVIKLYKKGKKFAEDVDFAALSKETTGFSPAAIEALLNEAAIISVQNDKRFIDKETIDKAMFKVLLSGHVKENQADRNKDELRMVAWHEAGHALVGKLNGKSIPKVTILSTTSGAGGVTFTTPKDAGLYSVDDLRKEVSELYAGRVAELLFTKDKNKITTGASNDIQKATDIICGIVSAYGMSDEFGMLNLHQLRVSQSKIIEEEVKLAKEIENQTISLLSENYEILQAMANCLLEHETLYEHDLDRIISNPQDCPETDLEGIQELLRELKLAPPVEESTQIQPATKANSAKNSKPRNNKNPIDDLFKGLAGTIGRITSNNKKPKNKT